MSILVGEWEGFIRILSLTKLMNCVPGYRDQATVYRQVGLLPTHVPFGSGSQRLRLPTLSGHVSALKLASPGSVPSNEMLGSDFGVKSE